MVIHVTVQSPDGTYKHPYHPDEPVSRVRGDAFDAIKPSNISSTEAFLLFAGTRITDESLSISHFAGDGKHETISFTLAWNNPAGV